MKISYPKMSFFRYRRAAEEAKRLGLGILFTKVNIKSQPLLKQLFSVTKYPKILFWDRGFPGMIIFFF